MSAVDLNLSDGIYVFEYTSVFKVFDYLFLRGIMKEKTLLKIAIISALAGVFLLYVISDNIEVSESSIEGIEGEEIGRDVKVKGLVRDVFNGEKISIITISQPSDMKVLLYDNVSISAGDYIEVIGEIDEYEGEREVIGNRVRRIN